MCKNLNNFNEKHYECNVCCDDISLPGVLTGEQELEPLLCKFM